MLRKALIKIYNRFNKFLNVKKKTQSLFLNYVYHLSSKPSLSNFIKTSKNAVRKVVKSLQQQAENLYTDHT